MRKVLVLGGALVGAFALFLLATVTPPARGLDAPAGAFSAARAMADVRLLGSMPHPIGALAHDEVRARLQARMAALGLEPRVQSGESLEIGGRTLTGGRISNLIGILPGHDRAAPALVLMAHYDSVWGSPGAADDTAGVASVLEIVRAIRTRGAPLRDVMVVITDGEEAGLLGARVFFADPAFARRVGYVLNLETRGGGGRTAMFETARENGGDVALYRRTAVLPDSNSLTVFVYKMLPNDTDFTVALQHGKPGLNYAFIGRQFDYHSPSSTPQALDQGALQHMGASILPTAAALAFGPLPPRAPDQVYGDLFGVSVLAYPAAAGWIVLAAAAGLIAAGALRGRGRGPFALTAVLRGAGVSLYVLSTSVAALALVRRATGAGAGFIAYRPLLARFPVFEAAMLCAGICVLLAASAFPTGARSRWIRASAPLIAALGACLFGGFDAVVLASGGLGAVFGAASFGAPARAREGGAGVMIPVFLAAVVLQVSAPTAAFVCAWPLLTAALVFALCPSGAASRRDLVISGAAAALLLGWLMTFGHELLQGLDLPAACALPVWLALPILWPLLAPEPPVRSGGRERRSAGVFAVVCLAFGALAALLAGYLRFTSPWSPGRPNAAEPVLVSDPERGGAWRASLLPPDGWVRRFLTAEHAPLTTLHLLPGAPPVAAAATGPLQAAPARAETSIGPGSAAVRITAPEGAARLIVGFSADAPIDAVGVDGVVADKAAASYRLPAGAEGRLIWAGPALTVRFRTANPASLRLRILAVYDRWMAPEPAPPLPAGEQMWDLAGSTLVLSRAGRPEAAPGPPGR